MRIRVLSYNIHKGFSALNTQLTLRQIKRSIDTTQADLVFLQEVVGHHSIHSHEVDGWPPVPQFEFLADRVWPHFAYGKNAVYDEGHHGNAILSKFPIEAWSNTNISTNRFEQRGFLHAQIELPGTDQHFHAFCLHLNLLERGRLTQIDQLIEFIRTQISPDDPVIVAGDFNDWTGACSRHLETNLGLIETHKALHGGYARTFPAIWPIMHLDRIFIRGFEITMARSLGGGVWRELSDHLALESELLIKM